MVINATAAQIAEWKLAYEETERARQVLLDEWNEALARIVELKAVLRTFLAKWDECEPHVNDAFFHRQLRMGAYGGPQFGEELEALRTTLAGPITGEEQR